MLSTFMKNYKVEINRIINERFIILIYVEDLEV